MKVGGMMLGSSSVVWSFEALGLSGTCCFVFDSLDGHCHAHIPTNRHTYKTNKCTHTTHTQKQADAPPKRCLEYSSAHKTKHMLTFLQFRHLWPNSTKVFSF